jgi:signal transduction histidine kinase
MTHLELLHADRYNDPVVREHLDVVIPQLVRLLGILDRTRGYAIAAINIRVPVDVGQSLRSIAALFEHYYRASGVHIRLDIPSGLPRVFGSAAQLQQVWVNYMQNGFDAIRRTGTDGKIRIKALADNTLHTAIVEITDDGAGMDPATLKLLNEGRQPAGSRWIGTTEAARIVAEHGGTVKVFSEMGKGTTVRVTLPTAPEDDNSGL